MSLKACLLKDSWRWNGPVNGAFFKPHVTWFEILRHAFQATFNGKALAHAHVPDGTFRFRFLRAWPSALCVKNRALGIDSWRWHAWHNARYTLSKYCSWIVDGCNIGVQIPWVFGREKIASSFIVTRALVEVEDFMRLWRHSQNSKLPTTFGFGDTWFEPTTMLLRPPLLPRPFWIRCGNPCDFLQNCFLVFSRTFIISLLVTIKLWDLCEPFQSSNGSFTQAWISNIGCSCMQLSLVPTFSPFSILVEIFVNVSTMRPTGSSQLQLVHHWHSHQHLAVCKLHSNLALCTFALGWLQSRSIVCWLTLLCVCVVALVNAAGKCQIFMPAVTGGGSTQ